MKRESLSSASSASEVYLAEINRFPTLKVEEEQNLARTYLEKGDSRAARRLVTANLRFVVKVAYQYRSYGFNMADLIQEGNLGLMKAVQKFDPEKGTRLITYAVWWIQAYIRNYIVKSFSLVKLGTTQAERKLFFALGRTKRELDKVSAEHGVDSDGEDAFKIAKKLRVKPSEVEDMTQRMLGRDVSLDASMGDDGDTHIDFLVGHGPSQDQEFSRAQEQSMAKGRVGEALARLGRRERCIIEQRIMSDRSMTLRELGDRFSFSRERARQLEFRAKGKLKQELHGLAVELGWPTDSEPLDTDDRPVLPRHEPAARCAERCSHPSQGNRPPIGDVAVSQFNA
jgi:RNA polymerase sigma-32 factor